MGSLGHFGGREPLVKRVAGSTGAVASEAAESQREGQIPSPEGMPAASGQLNLAAQGIIHDLVFSVTDADTVAWASGSLIFSDGVTYTIDAGNTGNMAARTFIYFDRAVSTTVLQVTTTLATAVGDGKAMLATAINGTTEPEFFVYGGIGGLNINGSVIVPGTVGSAALNLADRGWIQTCAFSVTDLNTIAWGAGSFIAADGTTYSIGAGNTGNMAARTYIYLDIAVSTTAYQVTTTASTAVGAGKVMIGTAINGTDEAEFELFVAGVGGSNINASQIVAGSITANEIAASTITAGKISVTSLSAIQANMGDITSGTMAIGSSNSILKFNATDGLFLGNATFGSAPFRVSLAGALTATSATITGAIDANSGTIGALTVDGTLTIGTGGSIKSDDYVAGTTGFLLSPTGGLEVNAGTIRGDVVGALRRIILTYYFVTSIGDWNGLDTSGTVTWNGAGAVSLDTTGAYIAKGGTGGTPNGAFTTDKNPYLECKFSGGGQANPDGYLIGFHDVAGGIGYTDTANLATNAICIVQPNTGNAQLRCRKASTNTDLDLGFSSATDAVIKVTITTTSVNVMVDGVDKGSITTNIPLSSTDMIFSATRSERTLSFSYIYIERLS